VVKVPDYNAESRGFETLPSDIYLFENFLAADSSGCLFCHNLDEDIPVLAVETRAGDALEAASPAEAPLGELTAQEIILCQAEDAFCMAFPPKMDTPLIRCTTTPLKTPQRVVRCGRSERMLTEVALPSSHARTFLAHRVGAAAESRWTIMWVPLRPSRVGQVLRSAQIRRIWPPVSASCDASCSPPQHAPNRTMRSECLGTCRLC